MGGLPSLSPAYPAFSLPFRPHPPAPLPGGKGAFFSLFCRGLRPRHPGIKPPAALIVPAEQVPKGGLPLRGTGYPRRCGARRGGLPSLSPANPAFSLISFPHPPTPLPDGKGEIFSLFCRGLRPRHPGIKPPAALTEPAEQVPKGD